MALVDRTKQLKECVISLEEKLSVQDHKLSIQDQRLLDKDKQIAFMEEEIRLLRIQKFGRSSEQYITPNQLSLFDEKESDIPEMEDEPETVEVPGHTRKSNRGKRQPIPENLERVRIEYKLDGAELMGPDGEQYIKIGESISEQLDIVPAEVRVLQHVRFKYAVKNKEELGVKTAPITNQAIPKSMASSGLLAHMAQAKYCHHLPLYRQEMIWRSLDVFIPRNSMCRWMLRLGEKCRPIVDELLEQIKSQKHLHIDETTVTVIDDKNKKADSISPSHNGYMGVVHF
jgi:transposase